MNSPTSERLYDSVTGRRKSAHSTTVPEMSTEFHAGGTEESTAWGRTRTTATRRSASEWQPDYSYE